MGRESFLAKVEWENGWPVINPGIGKLCKYMEIPLEECRFANEISHHDHLHFYEDRLDDRLLGIHKRNTEQYSLKAREGFLRLFAGKEKIEDKSNASYLGIRQKDYCFEVRAGLEFVPEGNESAGLVYYQNHANHLRMEIKKKGDSRIFYVVEHILGNSHIISGTEIGDGMAEIILRAENQKASVWIKTEGEQKPAAENINLLPYTTEEAGGFVGCTVGMYASANGDESSNYADFAWLLYDAVSVS